MKSTNSIFFTIFFGLVPLVTAADINNIGPRVYQTPDTADGSGYDARTAEPNENLPFKKVHPYEYSDHVLSITEIRLWPDGAWEIKTVFSNGTRFDVAKRMRIRAVVVTKDGKCLFGAGQEANVPSTSGLGSANEIREYDRGRIPVEEIPLATRSVFSAKLNYAPEFNRVQPYGQTLPNAPPRGC